MLSTLWLELMNFLSSLEQTQDAMIELLASKRRALDKFQPEELARLAPREEELATQLGALIAKRAEILAQARSAGISAETLKELAGAIGRHSGDARLAAAVAAANTRITRAQERTMQLRHESWIHWIISHKNYQHYSDVLEMIAHGGRASPTYGDPPGGGGGALLDAAV
jgi:FlgN protein